jgi:[ribosomal protein S5]-alanine N-acetyltransferase
MKCPHTLRRQGPHEIIAIMDKVIDTGRLILRRFTLDDLPAFYQLASRPEIIRYAQSTPVASLDEARELMHAAPFHDYATYGYGRFACVWKETGDVIGFSGLKFVPEIGDTELGYRFFPEYWGKGLATEAGRASIEFARSDLGLKRLVAIVHPDNVASAGVLSKLGFSVERKLAYSGLEGVEVDLFARSI